MMMSILESVSQREDSYLYVRLPSPWSRPATPARPPQAPTLTLAHTCLVSLEPTLLLTHSVDLFARVSNDLAIGLYESLGYRVFRTVEAYYGGGPKEPDENAYGKSLSSWDTSLRHVIILRH